MTIQLSHVTQYSLADQIRVLDGPTPPGMLELKGGYMGGCPGYEYQRNLKFHMSRADQEV